MVVDKRFSEKSLAILISMLGKEFRYFRCDPFSFNNMTYRVVSLFVGEYVYQVQNEAKVQAYFGAQEDICNLDVVQVSESDAHSMLSDVEQIDIPFNTVIVQINVVSETQRMMKNELLLDEYHFVRSIVFVLSDGREIAFDKTDDFSEQIAIRRGHNLIDQIPPIDTASDLDSGFCMQVTRDVQCFM